jgi:hypothetical protein
LQVELKVASCVAGKQFDSFVGTYFIPAVPVMKTGAFP